MKCMQYHKELLLEVNTRMKNPNGFGSIAKLSGNRRKPYIVRVTTGYEFNKEKDKVEQKRLIVGYARTKAEALELLNQYNQTPFDTKERNTTFKEVFDRWYTEYQKGNPSRSSRLAYESAIKDLAPLWDRAIRDLKTVDLQRVMDNCGKNYPTMRKINLCIKQVYKYALKYDIAQKDYSAFVDITKHKDKNPNKIDRSPFTREEIATLWDNSNDWGTQTILIYIYTGLRATELLELKKKDVDLKNRVFKVIRSKTDTGIRTVPIADKIYPFFEAMYNANNSEYLITTLSGEEMLYRNYRDTFFKPLMLRYNMDHHIHDTRHTCISLLTLADVKPVTIKKIVGHKGAMSLTEKVYTHLDYEELLTAINSI